MTKFKVGDKVMVVSRFKDSWYGEEHFNRIFTIKEIHKTYCKFEELDEYGGFVLDHITHAQQSPKSMLQNGMRVRLRNNKMYTYIDGYFTNICPGGNGLEYLSEVATWVDDLHYYRGVDVESEWDVMEIFTAPNIYDYFNYKIKTRSLWTRKEKSFKQIQLEQLQKQSFKRLLMLLRIYRMKNETIKVRTIQGEDS